MARIVVIIVFFLMNFTISKLYALELTERDNGQTVRLQQVETLTVNLEGNPTTGHNGTSCMMFLPKRKISSDLSISEI